MLNWLEIIILIVVSIVALHVIYRVIKNYNTEFDSSDNLFGTLMCLSIIGFFGCMFSGIFLSSVREYTGNNEVRRTASIVSLENATTTTGNVMGSAFGFSGASEGVVTCNFIIEESDGMRYLTEDTDRIVFHEATDGKVQAIKTAPTFIYKYAITKTVWVEDARYTWHVYIPKESINRYIKFN